MDYSPKINVKVIEIPIIFYKRTSYSLFKDVGFGKILEQNRSLFYSITQIIHIGKLFIYFIGCIPNAIDSDSIDHRAPLCITLKIKI